MIDVLRRGLPPEYEVEDFIAQGGQGSVFRGRYRGSPAALKVFPGGANPRIDRELAILRDCDCPTLIRVLADTTIRVANQAARLVAYPLLTGGDLAQQLLADPNSQRDARAIARIGSDVGGAIEWLWQRRIVHRDVKPQNIVGNSADGWMLVDLGVAAHLDLTTITRTGAAPGTRGYKSPEQARGQRPLSVTSDIYALGLTLYECASRHPFDYDQGRIGRDALPSLARARGDLPVALVGLIESMLSARQFRRPTAVGASFQRFLD
jgi:serine/threonine-protein kinase